jgi:hypothetical protein
MCGTAIALACRWEAMGSSEMLPLSEGMSSSSVAGLACFWVAASSQSRAVRVFFSYSPERETGRSRSRDVATFLCALAWVEVRVPVSCSALAAVSSVCLVVAVTSVSLSRRTEPVVRLEEGAMATDGGGGVAARVRSRSEDLAQVIPYWKVLSSNIVVYSNDQQRVQYIGMRVPVEVVGKAQGLAH